MNWTDFNFWFFGPTSIWFLGAMVLFCAISWHISTRKIISGLKETAAELTRGVTELQHIASRLGQDNCELQKGTRELKESAHDLKEEMNMTRQTICRFSQTLKRACWWIPHEKEEAS